MAENGHIERYDPAAVEARWHEIWDREGVFDVPNPAPGDTDERFYVLEMLPYPSGELHMGHVKNYTMGDVVTLYRRRNGHRVMHPMGYDAFGLPAENAAIRSGRHPAESTRENIAAIRRQMQRMGWSIDWNRELSTCEPDYYRWTQWIFLRLHEAGLAYRKSAVVKWCPKDQTVLANEQVIDGRCERCGTEVEARTLDQWFFKITDYADRLLDDLEHVQWPERVVTMQRNWIGRSHGAEVDVHARRRHRAAGLHDAARHALRGDVLRAGAGASAGRRDGDRASTPMRWPSTSATPRPARRSSAPRHARRPASSRAGT